MATVALASAKWRATGQSRGRAGWDRETTNAHPLPRAWVLCTSVETFFLLSLQLRAI